MAHLQRAKPPAQVRKAARLLSDAIPLLEACGVTIAVDHCRLALSAAVAAAEEYKTQAAAAKVRQRVAASMPSDKESLIREDGTLRYVSHMKRSGKRPEVVAVSFRVPGLPSLMTSFTLVGREFDGVYEAAVRALARHLGVIDDVVLIETMLSTRSAFKARYGL
ncbi:hypothetical protein CBP36_21120 (plasmid) [Acidovorax carolinensis]|uniref:Uncharacterized protein n=1 Tax=Acidovorax carolinensis TaxID=553814 RepID=A0A240UJ02_9BURK|nr:MULTISPECIES: hypothetical protein [Comamonadaceae]ART61471.1 hypothetical protein CBP36_21120 [Acidovorax carolinensis]POR07971.1 hypothetical protein BV908_18490 [Diaphorobacter sp. LR2014-1]